MRTRTFYGTVHLVYDGGVVCPDHQFPGSQVLPYAAISSEAREARRLVWELGMFHGLWGTQADKLFPLYLESNTDTVLVWL